jgi:glycosyltransferase involved in cell wall biosynthesis
MAVMEQTIRNKASNLAPIDQTKTMLVISSYGRPCGIAQYLEAIEPVLRSQAPCNFEIAALPVDLLRSQSPTARTTGRQVFEDILAKARKADVVNIQLEPGLLGLTPFDIWKRLKAIINASRRVIITYHTVPSLKGAKFGLRPRQMLAFLASYRGNYVFDRLFALIRKNPGKFHHIVQTRREVRSFQLLGLPADTISDQPLSFVVQSDRAALINADAKGKVMEHYGISEGKLIGCFGFLTPYKGIEVAIHSLDHLPPDYHVLIAGGLHPEGIGSGAIRQGYVDHLIELTTKGKRDKSRNVHFLGALNDQEFMDVLAACDAVVLPYAEVGQTSSGPASMALDLQRPVYCSRNFCFLELDAYQPGMLTFFEIGNHLELAQKLARNDGDRPERVAARAEYSKSYNAETRAALYWKAFDKLVTTAN